MLSLVSSLTVNLQAEKQLLVRSETFNSCFFLQHVLVGYGIRYLPMANYEPLWPIMAFYGPLWAPYCAKVGHREHIYGT
jgi:hypothetical protein